MNATHLLVGNPTAQSGKNAERIDQARALLDTLGVPHDFMATLPHGATVEGVSQRMQQHPYTVAIYMGGDGTFAEVAKGILRSGRQEDIRLGMLPTGTANDQGKSFGLRSNPGQLEYNVRVIAEGLETRLDVGKIRAEEGPSAREDLFFDSAGWGISPRVLQLRNEDRKAIAAIPLLRDIYRDQLVYAGAFLRTFLASYVEDQNFDAVVHADGQVHEWRGLTDLIIKGTRIYGGRWIFDDSSKHDDGVFEVVPFLGRNDWLSKAIVHFDGSGLEPERLERLGITHSRGIRASQIKLTLSARSEGSPLCAQIDGEEFPATSSVTIEVLRRALRIIVPQKYADPR